MPSRSIRQAAFVAAVVLSASARADAQSVVVDDQGRPLPSQELFLPYAFANDGFGAAAAFVWGRVGYPEPQSSLIATAIAGTAPSGAFMLLGKDLRLPGTERWFLDPFVSLGYYGENDVYIDGNPRYPAERAGSHDSDPEDFISGEGLDNLFKLRLKYVLPFGNAAKDPLQRLRVDRGLPRMDGARAATDAGLGRIALEAAPFYRALELDSDDLPDERTVSTNGAEASLIWDRRDFVASPSAGQSIRMKVIRDFGWFGSDDSWTSVQAEVDQYFSLGATESFRQRVIALDAFTSNSPTWEVDSAGEVRHGAPPFYGSTLGGLWRMRAFAPQRFSDKAAMYYAAELRLVPEWNPVAEWSWLQQHVGVQWVQVATFVEVGRVASDYDLKELHSRMQWDAGIGVRANARGLVIRVDAAVGPEGAGVRMMIGQPFQF